VTDNGVAQLNDFGMSQLMDVKGFTTKIMRNVRFSAPELMPITEQKSDIHPTFETDIFGLAMLLLQVCLLFLSRAHANTHRSVCNSQLFHGPDRDLQSRLPYNHVRHRNGNDYDFRLVRRIHDGERPIRHRYRTMYDQHWALLCYCWDGNPDARPDITYVVNAL